ncbi:MAG: cytochrome-c peroxidase [Alphaproteobacteria bacterium]|nr:cytochrome-c peroxidase [Alphaproteobacteria bacterium]
MLKRPLTSWPSLLALMAGCAATKDAPSESIRDSEVEESGADSGDTGSSPLEQRLRALVASLDPRPEALAPPAPQDPALVALGEALFFDPLLSGNKDVACASCHHPEHGLGDALPLAFGTGATGVGPARAEGERPGWLPRHSPPLYNLDSGRAFFWDGRVEVRDGQPSSASYPSLPEGLSGPLAAQALHPLLDPDEMLGRPGDLDINGESNDLAVAATPTEAWALVAARVLESPGYAELLAAAWPDTEVGIAELANALAAFQVERFSMTDTPWDRWLRGEIDALTDAQRLGAQLFYGQAGCGVCHQGAALSDGLYHNIGVLQLGPGTALSTPYDAGRFEVTGEDSERFAFKTPGLRNVALTAPYMHNGAFADLEQVVVHYGAPQASAADYEGAELPEELRASVRSSAEDVALLHATLSGQLPQPEDGSGLVGLSNLREFLEALTDPAALQLETPDEVPSGLPVPGT